LGVRANAIKARLTTKKVIRHPEQQLKQPRIRLGHERGQCHSRRRYQRLA
jgi:hypothetical protein